MCSNYNNLGSQAIRHSPRPPRMCTKFLNIAKIQSCNDFLLYSVVLIYLMIFNTVILFLIAIHSFSKKDCESGSENQSNHANSADYL